jgi:8-oxo-dGTP pyrophosphatase MutT (NUDIX family)
MVEHTTLHWLEWAREIQAISQIGLTYSQSEYDTQRYQRLMAIAAEIVHSQTDLSQESVLKNFQVQPGEVVTREVWEESGFQVIARKVIGIYDANRSGQPLEFYHAYKIVFLCDITEGQARPSYETQAVEFFAFDTLPPLSLNRTNQRHLDDVRFHLHDHNRPADFD